MFLLRIFGFVKSAICDLKHLKKVCYFCVYLIRQAKGIDWNKFFQKNNFQVVVLKALLDEFLLKIVLHLHYIVDYFVLHDELNIVKEA